MKSKKFSSKHSLAIRWFHWINFPVLFIMIWSGTLIYWANDVYKINAGSIAFQFYPDSLYKALNIPFKLAQGMSWHFLFMWVFFINGFLYVTYLIFSGEWRLIFPNRSSLKDSFLVVLHDLHIIKKAPAFIKYNAAQRVAYSLIIVMGFFSILSGLAIYKPAQFSGLTSLIGGYENARLIHFILTIGFMLFFLIHVLQVIIAGWNNFRAMVTGWEIVKIETASENTDSFNEITKDVDINSGENKIENEK